MSEETPNPQPTDSQTPPAPAPEAAPPSAAPQTTGTYSKEQKDKKLIAGILGILLGALGIHKFFLGYNKEGVIMLVISVVSCGFAAPITGIIGLVEGILYLTKTEDEFVSTYVVGRKPWF